MEPDTESSTTRIGRPQGEISRGTGLACIGRFHEALVAFDDELKSGIHPDLLVWKALTLDRIGFFRNSAGVL